MYQQRPSRLSLCATQPPSVADGTSKVTIHSPCADLLAWCRSRPTCHSPETDSAAFLKLQRGGGSAATPVDHPAKCQYRRWRAGPRLFHPAGSHHLPPRDEMLFHDDLTDFADCRSACAKGQADPIGTIVLDTDVVPVRRCQNVGSGSRRDFRHTSFSIANQNSGRRHQK